MINSNDRIVKHKLGLLNLADELSNVYRKPARLWALAVILSTATLIPKKKVGFTPVLIEQGFNPTLKTPITAADMLNDKVLSFYEDNDLPVQRILTDRGTEYCGKAETHDYQLYLAINQIDHTKTKVKSPQTNGICERFHRTILDEFYRVAFRKKLYESMEELQKDLDIWLNYYNTERAHQGKGCKGRTPMQTLIDGKQIWKDKFVDQI